MEVEVAQAIEGRVTYFGKPGKDNTEAVLGIARRRAEELGIRTILVATTEGTTGARAAAFFSDGGYRVVVVTHATGFKTANFQEVTEENRLKMLEHGATILTVPHVFAGVGRAVRRRFSTYELDDIIAQVLRIVGQGMKVVCEVACMAADCGAVRTDEEVIAIAGTGRGADTDVVIKPANTFDFFALRVKGRLCKPR